MERKTNAYYMSKGYSQFIEFDNVGLRDLSEFCDSILEMWPFDDNLSKETLREHLSDFSLPLAAKKHYPHKLNYDNGKELLMSFIESLTDYEYVDHSAVYEGGSRESTEKLMDWIDYRKFIDDYNKAVEIESFEPVFYPDENERVYLSESQIEEILSEI